MLTSFSTPSKAVGVGRGAFIWLFLVATAVPVSGQTDIGAINPKSELPSDAASVIQALRDRWGLGPTDLATDEVAYWRAGDELSGSASWTEVERDLLSRVAQASKLIEGFVGPDRSPAIKKVTAVTASRLRIAGEAASGGGNATTLARREIRRILSDYLVGLSRIVGSTGPE